MIVAPSAAGGGSEADQKLKVQRSRMQTEFRFAHLQYVSKTLGAQVPK